MERVNWKDAVESCRRLSEKEGKEYRLPTEAEWEYACRAGTTTAFAFGESLSSKTGANFGWYSDSSYGPSQRMTAEVGSFRANSFGLFDMHGNVSELCSDRYARDYYASSQIDDPKGPALGLFRVYRGGSWGSVSRSCRSAARYCTAPEHCIITVGFRVAQTLSEQTNGTPRSKTTLATEGVQPDQEIP